MSWKEQLAGMIEKMRAADPERLARLEAMGYDTKKVYFHGTETPFDEFNPNKSGGSYGPGIYFSDNPDTASIYAKKYVDSDGGRVIPVFLKKGNYLNTQEKELSGIERQELVRKLSDLLDQAPEKNRMLSDFSYDGTIESGKKNFQDAVSRIHPTSSVYELWERGYNKNTSDLGKKLTAQDIQGFEAEFGKKFIKAPEETYKIIPDESNIKSIWAKGKGPGLIGGTAAAALLASPSESTAEEINPLNLLGSLVNKYRGAQEKVADVITEQVNPYKKQPVDETTKGLGRMMFDPLNLVEGPIGHALMGIELMSNKKEKLP